MVKNGVLYFVHNDHIGRPEFVTNSAKTIVWSSQNNAFDNVPAIDSIGGMNVGFPGQYYDIESGMHYNYFRTYDSGTGRYLQSDPAGIADGLNIYAYADSNPLSYVDPFGLGRTPPPRSPNNRNQRDRGRTQGFQTTEQKIWAQWGQTRAAKARQQRKLQQRRIKRMEEALAQKRAEARERDRLIERTDDAMSEAERMQEQIEEAEEMIRKRVLNEDFEFGRDWELEVGIFVGESSCEVLLPGDFPMDFFRR